MKKDKYTVKTSVFEVIIVALISALVFFSVIFLALLPYIGNKLEGVLDKGKGENVSEKIVPALDIPRKVFGEDATPNEPSVFEVTVDGDSMLNTYRHGDKLMAREGYDGIKVNDIVVFLVPEYYEQNKLIKRVIATGGQTVNIDFDNWIVTVDGVPLAADENGNPVRESYVNYSEGSPMHVVADPENPITYPYTVPEGHIFVLGDNRNNSSDSRRYGAVKLDNVVGIVITDAQQ